MTREAFIESTFCQQDEKFEVPLRPGFLKEFRGQEAVCDRLLVMIEAARGRGEPLNHCLLSGPPGLGKTTLASILAKEMGTNIVITSGPAVEKAKDLAGLLTSLQPGDFLFIDEIHQLSRQIEEYLYPAMEDFSLDLVVDSGPSARSVQLKLNPFTLVAATTRTGLLTGPLRSRFAFSGRLEYYGHETLSEIVIRTASILKIGIEAEGAMEIAKRARGTPRIANNLLRWVRDYAETRAGNRITKEVANQALAMLAIDEKGLDELDKKLLEVMIDFYNGGPVGVNNLAVALGEEAATLEEVVEPYLIGIGFIQRTPRGRIATPLAYEHLGKFLRREP